MKDQEVRLLPKISFKGVSFFILLLFVGILLIPIPLQYIGLPEEISNFIAASISSSIGLVIVLTIIDGKPEEKPLFKKRILISIVVSVLVSALMTFGIL